MAVKGWWELFSDFCWGEGGATLRATLASGLQYLNMTLTPVSSLGLGWAVVRHSNSAPTCFIKCSFGCWFGPPN